MGRYITYGIQAIRKTALGWEMGEIIHDVTTELRLAAELAQFFNRYQLSPIHLRDVIEDMIP